MSEKRVRKPVVYAEEEEEDDQGIDATLKFVLVPASSDEEDFVPGESRTLPSSSGGFSNLCRRYSECSRETKIQGYKGHETKEGERDAFQEERGGRSAGGAGGG